MVPSYWQHLLWSSLLFGCVSTQSVDVTQDKVDSHVTVIATSKPFDYRLEGKGYKLETFYCETEELKKATAPYVVVIGSDDDAWSTRACENDYSRLFYTAGYRLVLINPPGVGESNGPNDLGGDKELSAYRHWLSAHNDSDIWGVWAIGANVIGAARFSREINGIKFAVFGNGIYDLELASSETQDEGFKKNIEDLIAIQGEGVFDQRSASWDPEGLPRQIFIYHGSKTTLVSNRQADRFKDSLVASGFDVRISIIQDQGDDISLQEHLGVLRGITAKLASHLAGKNKP